MLGAIPGLAINELDITHNLCKGMHTNCLDSIPFESVQEDIQILLMRPFWALPWGPHSRYEKNWIPGSAYYS